MKKIAIYAILFLGFTVAVQSQAISKEYYIEQFPLYISTDGYGQLEIDRMGRISYSGKGEMSIYKAIKELDLSIGLCKILVYHEYVALEAYSQGKDEGIYSFTIILNLKTNNVLWKNLFNNYDVFGFVGVEEKIIMVNSRSIIAFDLKRERISSEKILEKEIYDLIFESDRVWILYWDDSEEEYYY